MCWRRSASSAGATVDGRIVSEMSANALFFVQWCVFLARVHHRATEAVCVHDVAVAYCGSLAASLPAHLKTAKLRNARCHLSSNYWYFPPHTPPGPPLCVPVTMLSTWVHSFALSNRGRMSWIVDVFQGARVQNSAKNLGVRDRTPSSVPR